MPVAVANIYRTSAFGPALPPRLVSGGVALYANGTGTASFDTLRVTQWPDPSAPLANAGRAINSVVNWNGNIPANTSLAVSTSTDNGVTYQSASAAGNSIPGISTLLYSTLALQRKPSGYYHLSESSGTTANDSSGNGNNGTLHGGVTPGQPGALQGPGELSDTAMSFDGSSGYISYSSSITSTASDFWVEMWAQVSDFTAVAGAARRLLTVNIDNTSGFQMALQDTHTAFVWAVNDPTGQVIVSKSGFTTGVWYHLVGVWKASTRTATLYINGVAQTNDAIASGYGIGSIGANIGRRTDAVGYFAGSLAEISFAQPTTANAVAPFVAADALARYNAGISQVGTVANDSFTVDTHTNYTSTFGVGGSVATWTWDTVNSRVQTVGGSKAVLLYNNLGAYDNDLWIDLYQSQNAGLIWGWQNSSNYYELIVKDSLASVSPNTVVLNKISGGSTTQLATASITWQVTIGGVTINQVHHRFHLTMLAATITVSMDENQILTYTDSTPLPAGSSGLRNDTGTSYIYLFQATPQPANLSATALISKHVLTSTDPTVTPQITDHQAFASDQSIGIGAYVPSADYRQAPISDNIDDLNTKSNYWWQVGSDKNIVFQARNAKNAPFILQSTDILIGTMPTVEYSGDLYRNRQVLKGVYDTSTFNETRLGDGQTRTWALTNPVVAPPAILLNGLPVSIGLQGKDTGRQYYYTLNGSSIVQDNSQTILKTTDVLAVTYTGSFGIDFELNNTGQFTNTISQAQMKAIDKTGTGINEQVEDVSDRAMNLAAATAYANQLLQRYGSIARTLKCDTLHNGLKAGHSLPVFIPQLNIFDSVFLVVEVTIRVRTTASGIQYVNSIVCSEAAALASWQKMFNRIMRSVSGTKPKA